MNEQEQRYLLGIVAYNMARSEGAFWSAASLYKQLCACYEIAP